MNPTRTSSIQGMVTMAGPATLDRDQWMSTLDQLSRQHEGEKVMIEVLDPSYGDNTEAERLPFSYASYDPKDDVVVVAVGGNSPQYPVVLRHMVSHPTDLAASTDAAPAIKVTDADGTTTVVSFVSS
jgi:hypothetical protein